MSEAVVHANQRAEPSVDTAIRVAAVLRLPPRYIAQAAIGSRPASTAGVERAITCVEISRRCWLLRAMSSRARCARTGAVAPASFTERAADRADTSPVAKAA